MNFDWISEYAPYISTLGTFLGIVKAAPVQFNKFLNKWRDFEEDNDLNINEIYGRLEESAIHIGSNIYTSGYLLQHGQVFMPYTYTDSMFSPSSEDDVKDFNEKHKGTIHELHKGEILFKRKEFIIPTKKLNPLNNVGCAFLYDGRFRGFYSKENKENNMYAKPILVLYDINRHTKYVNNKVEIKGKLCVVPHEISKNLDLTYSDTTRDICDNFYRPFNESNNLICISLLPEDSKIEYLNHPSLEENLSDIEIPIFMEAKIEGLLENDKPERIIEGFLPNTYGKYLGIKEYVPAFRSESYDPITFPSTNNINVAYRNGNIGFYMNTSLIDKRKYQEDLKQYVRYVNNFAIDYKNFCKKELGRKKRMEISFISDDTKRNLFNGKYSACMFDDEKFKAFPEAEWMNNA